MKHPKQLLLIILDLEIWLAAAAVSLSMVSARFLPWSLLGMLLFWPIRRWVLGVWTRRTPGDLAILVLIFLLPVTILISTQPETTVIQSLRLLVGIAFFYAVVNWSQNKARLKLLLSGLLVANLGLILLALISVEWTTFKLWFIPAAYYERMAVLVEDTINANVMAGSLIVLFPVSLGLFFAPRRCCNSSLRWLSGFLLVANMLVLVLTQSRSALSALIIVAVVFILLRWHRGWLLLLTTCLMVGLMVLVTWPSWLRWWAQIGSGYLGFDERLEIWSRALLMVRDFPYTGIGMGSFPNITHQLYPFFTREPESVSHAHNLFLQIAVDLGIPGLIAWLSIVVSLMWISWQLFRFGQRQGDDQALILGLTCFSSLVALSAHGLADAVTWGMVRSAPLIWGVWGVTLAAWQVLAAQQQVAPKVSIVDVE